MNTKEGFLDRWSRLKETGEAEADASAIEATEAEAAEVDERTDDEILSDLGLPHPDDLKPGDDFSGFMAQAVPDRLRRVALRKLWRGNPVLANLDGLVEYGEDYTDSAMVVENLQTLYQVGKGMFVEPETPEEPDEDDPEGAVEELADAGEPEDSDQIASVAAPEDGESPVVSDAEEPVLVALDDAPAPQPTSRRMKFG